MIVGKPSEEVVKFIALSHCCKRVVNKLFFWSVVRLNRNVTYYCYIRLYTIFTLPHDFNGS